MAESENKRLPKYGQTTKENEVNTSLTTIDQNESELISVLQGSLYPGAAIPSVKMVLGYCKAAGLDPMQKPVHIVPMWDSKAGAMRDVVMPGVGLYRTQAARSGAFAGVTEPEFGEDITENIGGVTITYPAWCRVVVKRELPSGTIAEFSAVERWKENYAVKGGKEKSIAPNAMWMKRPYGQLSKCAEAQALRKAFPEVGSAPTADEMEGKEIEINPFPENKPGEKIPEFYPEEKFKTNFPKWEELIAAGKKPDVVIKTAESKGQPLTENQKALIRAVKKTDPKADDGVTFAMVADKLNSAKDIDLLEAAAELINEIDTPEQRDELKFILNARREELSQ